MGFDGVVMSEWWGTKSGTPAVNDGLDLEIPGRSVHCGDQIDEAVKNGEAAGYGRI